MESATDPAPDARAAYDAGLALYGALPVSRAEFAAAFASRSPAPGVAGADLFLAVACDRGVPGSWEVLRERFFPSLKGVLVSKGATGALADEILDDLFGDLCSPPPRGGARTRIGTFDGKGPLAGWLAIVAVRRFYDRVRARTAAPHPAAFGSGGSESGGGLTPPDGDPTPLQALAATERVRRFEDVLQEALAGLTSRERLAVLFKYRDGLPQREVARLLGVSDSRVTRLLQAGTDRMRKFVADRLRETPPGTREEALWVALEAAVARGLSNPAGPSDRSP
jgi:RNA polymerase sigma-70 factor (ECF subfamily)